MDSQIDKHPYPIYPKRRCQPFGCAAEILELVTDELIRFRSLGRLLPQSSACHHRTGNAFQGTCQSGLTGYEGGWKLTVGGNVGAQPRIGQELANDLNDGQAFEMIEKILQYYKANAKKGERLGIMIDRVGLDALKAAVS